MVLSLFLTLVVIHNFCLYPKRKEFILVFEIRYDNGFVIDILLYKLKQLDVCLIVCLLLIHIKTSSTTFIRSEAQINKNIFHKNIYPK